MSLATLPWWLFAAGVPLLAGALYLLQRLRSERRFVAFAAASLWASMPRATPHRVLGARFRYWLAFLLSLLIVLLLWLAVANPASAPPAGDAARLFYFDNSAALTGGEAAAARRALLADIRAAPARRRAVVLGDATGTPLLTPGESVSLLAARLDGVKAGARPSNFAAWLRTRVARLSAGQTLNVTYYGGWGAAQAALAGLPATVRMNYGYLAQVVPDNRGIVALGATPAASGRWRGADVLIELAGPDRWSPTTADLEVDHGGRAVTIPLTALGQGRFLLPDIDADGGELTVRLKEGDGFAADDRAAFRLPNRSPIKVGFAASVPAAIRQVAEMDDAFAVSGLANAAVIVRRAGDPSGGDRPALELTAGDGAAAFTFTGPQERTDGDLSGRLAEFGLDQIDAAALAERLRRPIGIEVNQAPVRSIAVWSALFDTGGSFARSPAMPIFVSQALRWLADERGWVPYAKAGASLPDQSRLAGWSGRPIDARSALGGRTLLGPSGETRIGGQPIAVALTDHATTAAVRETPPPGTVAVNRSAALLPPNGLVFAVLLAALLLLAAEWVAYQRGWMP